MVDEADLGVMDIMAGNSPGLERRGNKRNMDTPNGSPRLSKRKVGPLPRDFVLRRPNTPPVSPKHGDQDAEESNNERIDALESNSDDLFIDENPLEIPELLISNGGMIHTSKQSYIFNVHFLIRKLTNSRDKLSRYEK